MSGFCLCGNPPGKQKPSTSTVLSPMEESNKTLSIGIAGFCLQQKLFFFTRIRVWISASFQSSVDFLKELLLFDGNFFFWRGAVCYFPIGLILHCPYGKLSAEFGEKKANLAIYPPTAISLKTRGPPNRVDWS